MFVCRSPLPLGGWLNTLVYSHHQGLQDLLNLLMQPESRAPALQKCTALNKSLTERSHWTIRIQATFVFFFKCRYSFYWIHGNFLFRSLPIYDKKQLWTDNGFQITYWIGLYWIIILKGAIKAQYLLLDDDRKLIIPVVNWPAEREGSNRE